MLLGPLLIQTNKTIVLTGLEQAREHPHILLTILDARFGFLNWSSEIHVTEIKKIGIIDLIDIFSKVTIFSCPGELRGTLYLWVNKQMGHGQLSEVEHSPKTPANTQDSTIHRHQKPFTSLLLWHNTWNSLVLAIMEKAVFCNTLDYQMNIQVSFPHSKILSFTLQNCSSHFPQPSFSCLGWLIIY